MGSPHQLLVLMSSSNLKGLGGLALAALAFALHVDALVPSNPQYVKLGAKNGSAFSKRQRATFPQYNFTQPLDHFSDTGFTFQQRYWLSDRHYKPGGPVIVFEAGEGPGDERMPILDTGIVDILANATNGLGIVLEHRYYGRSPERILTDSG